MESSEIIRQVKKIEITTKHLVDGLLAGNYHSVFKGQGIEFSEIREYMPGDDIRAIDWKVTARYNHPYVKEFIEERDLHVYFALDMSGSQSFGKNLSKKRRAIEIAASLMFAAIRNNDKAGLFLFTTEVEKFIPARKGKRHILRLISEIVGFEPKARTTDIAKSLSFISKVVKGKSIIFLLSDLNSFDFSKQLRLLKKRHDVIIINLFDENEMSIPDVGLIELEDEETGEQILVDTSNDEFRRRYHENMQKHQMQIAESVRRSKADMVPMSTNVSYAIPLQKFFKQRKRRR